MKMHITKKHKTYEKQMKINRKRMKIIEMQIKTYKHYKTYTQIWAMHARSRRNDCLAWVAQIEQIAR